MSGMAAAYYERCTEKYLSTLYEQTVTGWQCKCGATFNTHDAVDHKCPITHPHLFAHPGQLKMVLTKVPWNQPVAAGEKNESHQS
jgi:hypothetical protein